MDLDVYHKHIDLGFSEREATRAGEDAWEDSRILDQREREHFAEMERQHGPEPEQ